MKNVLTTSLSLSLMIFFSGSCVQEKVNKVEEKFYEPTLGSIRSHPCPEWFHDAKFGMFIDYGLYSVAGYGESWRGGEGAKYPDWYLNEMDKLWADYHNRTWGEDFKRDDFIPMFTAEDYNPGELIEMAVEAGMKYVVPFCKHHDGFCLWPSSYTERDAVDTGPGRDLIQPLVDECRKHNLKFGFYFSLEEWEYPVIRNGEKMTRLWKGHGWLPGEAVRFVPFDEEDMKGKITGKKPVEDFTGDYIIPQANEFIDQYDPDILWFDGEWLTPLDEVGSLEITSYFFNNAHGRKEVVVNDRLGHGLRGKHGDFFTSEYHSISENQPKIVHKWEENRGISTSFGYNLNDTEENIISTQEFIDMFIRIVSENGNLLLIVNLDGKGALPGYIRTRLEDIGKWLKVNGEAIYGTRPWLVSHEGENLRFTQSKDGKFVYAICNDLSKDVIEIKSVLLDENSEITLLGVDHDLKWRQDQQSVKLVVEIPELLKTQIPSEYAYVLKIKF